MENHIEMPEKYTVLKNEDISRLPVEQRYWMETILTLNTFLRMGLGEAPVNQYIVINRDEPHAQEVIEVLKKHGHWE